MPQVSVEELADGIYLFTYNVHRSLFVVGDGGVLATDPQSPEAASAYLAEIRKLTSAPIRYLVYSHHHADHVSGGAAFPDDTVVVAHRAASPFVDADEGIRPVDVLIDGDAAVELGGVRVELIYPGPSETDSNLIVYVPSRRVAFMVDAVSVRTVPWRNLAGSDPHAWRAALARLSALDFDLLAAGHGPVGAKQHVVEYVEYFDAIIAAVQERIDRGEGLEQVQASLELPQYADWTRYDEHFELNIEGIYRGLTEGRQRRAELDLALQQAALAGDAARVEELIARGADPGAANPYDVTALSFAADRGHLEVVRVLLEHGADPNVVDTFYGFDAAGRALGQGHSEIVRLLVDHGGGGTQVLIDAVRRNDAELVGALLAGGNVDAYGLSNALSIAVQSGRAGIETRLREAGASEDPPLADTVPIAVEALRGMVGAYRDSQSGADVAITLDAGNLVATMADGEAHTLRHVGDRGFEADDDADVVFVFAGRGGSVEGIRHFHGETFAYFTPVDPEPEALAETEAMAPGAGPAADAGAPSPGDRGAPINWASFRGANGDGNGDGQGIPTAWDVADGTNIRWRTEIPGIANSSPIIWEDRVFLTTAVTEDGDETVRIGLYGDVAPVDDLSEHSFMVYALDKASGEIAWEREIFRGPPLTKRHTKSSQANSTPVADAEHLVAVFGAIGKLICLDHEGNLLWENDLGVLDSGWFLDPSYQWGHGSSPIIYDDLVILQADVQHGSFLAAYDIDTGEQVWRTEREAIPSWGTPVVYRGEPRDELITNGKTIRAHDPRTGELLWWLTPNSEVPVASPVIGDGLIYLSNRYPPVQRVYAVRPGGSGDISLADGETSNEWIEWSKTRSVTYIPSPILYDDLLYTPGNDGRLITYGAHTGEVVYQARIGGAGGSFVASPVVADGRIYYVSEECMVHVTAVGPEYRDLASIDMDDICWATPAISDGLLVIRTLRYVYGIGDE